MRSWNIAKNSSYINYVNQGSEYHEQEELDNHARYHDYLVTSLRTSWGADLDYIQSGRMRKEGNTLILSKEGMYIADHIITAMFLEA